MASETSVDAMINEIMQLANSGKPLSWLEEGRISNLLFPLTHHMGELAPEQVKKIATLLEHKSAAVVSVASTYFKFRESVEYLPQLRAAHKELCKRASDSDEWQETKNVKAAIDHLEGLHREKAREMSRRAPASQQQAVSKGNEYRPDMLQPGVKKGSGTPSGPKARK